MTSYCKKLFQVIKKALVTTNVTEVFVNLKGNQQGPTHIYIMNLLALLMNTSPQFSTVYTKTQKCSEETEQPQVQNTELTLKYFNQKQCLHFTEQPEPIMT